MASLRISLGYELEVRGRSREVEQRAFRNVIDQVVLGDRLGFDTAWFVEHHFTRGFSHSSAPDLVLAALSQRTERIRLGLGVVLLPFQSPVRTAERVATLDVVSGGRVEFGTGRGASPLEYQAFRRPFERSRQIWEDSLEATLAIWNADGEPVSRSNEYFEIPGVAVYPRPVQVPHPPVWVASTSLEGYLAAARHGHNLLGMTMLKGIDDVAEDIAGYRRCLADNGFDPDSRRVALMIPWFVAPSREQAFEIAADPVLWYIRRQVNLVTPPGYYDARHATHKVLGQLAAGMPPEEAMAVLREHHMVVIDDVEGSRKAAARVAEAGATDLILQAQVGGLAHEHVCESMRLFMTGVAG
ncbi:alkanesulfonate monooxygenase SsuD/methylene tetrahydromethanopterin reductase-like flavin-dependent oxidoreductase (luciferase family) [Streptosporangium becharense]|uniref:Alkanesulfonate monooxygenase SsuD/methylene tetrahydromethanopterin reductase-like flavin-dependent oxidoreductase (Luciferase family) n=1 Tax=Streptosporangium becharense TaxID=1816182 RepID=A0A7W9IDT2_9ACTN|nr:LLM class flavin-dependent oxidoreductase [Streptosporangium becharense]MBB2912290.1 alkanesulfonate monooxygenase SsuD/methylene tetrahydromethanopterin reductase-like flavin-dependent oxidoreductase (luciferase family) [Streptosporangium becharense]MBB5818837.1 alkanesulfonate monooxygenase SsuD/methylene tetrahydromethanopterin reductase-like flavin-dependent oxidoreductase (luciferase family) [Streptosporangium becharense]